MKKFNLLFITILCAISISCSSDDYSTQDQNISDPIIGQWKIVKESYFDLNGNLNFEQIPSSCVQQSIESYSPDGTYDWTSYVEESNGDCINIIASISNGQWELLSNGNYKVSGTVEYISSDTFSLNIEYDDATFSNYNSNLSLRASIQEFDSDGNLEDEYIRVFDYQKIN
ncbi:MAG: hypothetical protein AAGH46_03710 [Bacteroidota bacterium]